LALAGAEISTRLVDEVEPYLRAFDLVVEATGSPSGFPLALRLVRPCGTVVLKTTLASPHEMDLAPVVIDEVRVVGSRCGPFDRAIEALARKRFDVARLIGAEYTLDDAEPAFRAAAQPGARKVLLRVSPV
jgi:threonine dehydrogenase-like Zn-dependent dehydrogenase